MEIKSLRPALRIWGLALPTPMVEACPTPIYMDVPRILIKTLEFHPGFFHRSSNGNMECFATEQENFPNSAATPSFVSSRRRARCTLLCAWTEDFLRSTISSIHQYVVLESNILTRGMAASQACMILPTCSAFLSTGVFSEGCTSHISWITAIRRSGSSLRTDYLGLKTLVTIAS